MNKMRHIEELSAFIFMKDELEKVDLIMIPGSNNKALPMQAALRYREGYANLVMPTGKYSITQERFHSEQGPFESEFAFQKQILLECGVKEEHLLKEDESMYTYQNALFAKKCLEEANITIEKAIICCKSFHARRVYMYFQSVFPNVTFYMDPVDVDGITKTTWMHSPQGIARVLGELERCGAQFRNIIKV